MDTSTDPFGAGTFDSRSDSEGNCLPAELFTVRGTGVSDIEPCGGNAFRRGKSAYPSCNTNRFFPDGCAVHSG